MVKPFSPVKAPEPDTTPRLWERLLGLRLSGGSRMLVALFVWTDGAGKRPDPDAALIYTGIPAAIGAVWRYPVSRVQINQRCAIMLLEPHDQRGARA